MLHCKKMVAESAFRLVNGGRLDKIALRRRASRNGAQLGCGERPRALGREVLTMRQSGDWTMKVGKE